MSTGEPARRLGSNISSQESKQCSEASPFSPPLAFMPSFLLRPLLKPVELLFPSSPLRRSAMPSPSLLSVPGHLSRSRPPFVPAATKPAMKSQKLGLTYCTQTDSCTRLRRLNKRRGTGGVSADVTRPPAAETEESAREEQHERRAEGSEESPYGAPQHIAPHKR